MQYKKFIRMENCDTEQHTSYRVQHELVNVRNIKKDITSFTCPSAQENVKLLLAEAD